MVQDDAGSNEEQHGNEHSSNDQWLTQLRETRDGGAGGQNKNETLGGRRNTITHRHNFYRRKLSFRLLFPGGYLLMKPTPPAPWVFPVGRDSLRIHRRRRSRAILIPNGEARSGDQVM